MDPWEDEDCWTATRKEKKAIMGRFRCDPGGPVDAGLAATSKWKNREFEPVWFHQRPREFSLEMTRGIFGRSILDFHPHSGAWAWAALAQRLPYVG